MTLHWQAEYQLTNASVGQLDKLALDLLTFNKAKTGPKSAATYCRKGSKRPLKTDWANPTFAEGQTSPKSAFKAAED